MIKKCRGYIIFELHHYTTAICSKHTATDIISTNQRRPTSLNKKKNRN